MSENSSESSSSFEGWAVNDAVIDLEDQESTTAEYNYFKQFTLILQEDQTKVIVKKYDSVMVSGTEKLPFVGLIEQIYQKKSCSVEDEADDSSDEEISMDVRVVISWYYRKQDITVQDNRLQVPELQDCELLYSAHVNRIKAKFVMFPCEVFFVRCLEDIPTKFDITSRGKLSQARIPGFFVRKGCNVNTHGNITKFFALDESKTCAVQQNELDRMIVGQMEKTKGRFKELIQLQISEVFLMPISNKQSKAAERIQALTDYWISLTRPNIQYQPSTLVTEVKLVVPEFPIEDIQQLMIGISEQNIPINGQEDIVTKLLVILCLFALRLIIDIQSAAHPTEQQFGVLSQILEYVADSLTQDKKLMINELSKWMVQSHWNGTVSNLFSNQSGQKFQQTEIIVPFDSILKKLKLNKRSVEKMVAKQADKQGTKKSQESKRSPVKSEPKQEKPVQKKTKVQQEDQKKRGAGKKKGKAIQYVVDSSTDEEFDSAPQAQVASSMLDREAAENVPESQNPTNTSAFEQSSFTGGKFKFPEQPPHLNLLTMQQIRRFQTKVDMEEQKAKVGRQLKEDKQMSTKVSWWEDFKQEEGLYVMAYVQKQQDYFLEFVYVFDQHGCPEFLDSDRFSDMWPSQNWRKNLKLANGQSMDVSEWLKSKGWMEV